MAHVIIGILIVIAGVLIVAKTEAIYQNLGPMAFFEEKMGPGSSRLGYKIFGIIAILIGALVISNLWGGILMGAFGKFFTGLAQ